MDYAQQLVNKALEMGAENSKMFELKDIVFDERVILKCMFGCSDYGKSHTCPYQRSPLTMQEYERVFSKYKWGVIIGCGDKKVSQKISYAIEKQCFLDGHYFAFSLSDCGLCSKCAKADDKECRFPKEARPAFHSVGIDVFKTVRQLGMQLEVLIKECDKQNWYSAVFVE